MRMWSTNRQGSLKQKSEAEGNCRIYDPVEGYKVVFSSKSYDEALYWLLEDEYEAVEGRPRVWELV